MADLYPSELDAIQALTETLQAGSPLLAAEPALNKGKGVAIDLSGPAIPTATANSLRALHPTSRIRSPSSRCWPTKVAQQIWNILDRAITNSYTGTTDVVLVGGDSIIPFYRIPDETTLGNEGSYADVRAQRPNTALDGSLFYQFIQTDNFYADRVPTAWRSRALYLPDLGVGRLVESPTTIMHYLEQLLGLG